MSVNIKTFTWHRENGWNLTHNSSHPIQASCTHEALINESTTYKLPNITPHLLSWSVCHFGPQTEIMITFLKTYLVSMCTSGKVKDSLFVTVIVKKIFLHIYWLKDLLFYRDLKTLSKCPQENFSCKGTKSI